MRSNAHHRSTDCIDQAMLNWSVRVIKQGLPVLPSRRSFETLRPELIGVDRQKLKTSQCDQSQIPPLAPREYIKTHQTHSEQLAPCHKDPLATQPPLLILFPPRNMIPFRPSRLAVCRAPRASAAFSAWFHSLCEVPTSLPAQEDGPIHGPTDRRSWGFRDDMVRPHLQSPPKAAEEAAGVVERRFRQGRDVHSDGGVDQVTFLHSAPDSNLISETRIPLCGRPIFFIFGCSDFVTAVNCNTCCLQTCHINVAILQRISNPTIGQLQSQDSLSLKSVLAVSCHHIK